MFQDKVAEKRFAELQRQYQFKTCFETGTFQGWGALRASWYCHVVTIDNNQDYRFQAMQTWLNEHRQPVSFHPEVVFSGGVNCAYAIRSLYGNSPDVLRKELKKDYWRHPLCFYLDAHWGEYWPLLDELKVIAEAKLAEPPVIMIHDAKVPGTDFAFDNHNGFDLDYEYVKDGLAAINPDYKICYNDESFDIKRGILYALP